MEAGDIVVAELPEVAVLVEAELPEVAGALVEAEEEGDNLPQKPITSFINKKGCPKKLSVQPFISMYSLTFYSTGISEALMSLRQ